jgi:hypothetical protein
MTPGTILSVANQGIRLVKDCFSALVYTPHISRRQLNYKSMCWRRNTLFIK